MEKLPKDENDFLILMDKLSEMHEEDPRRVRNAVKATLRKLGAMEKSNNTTRSIWEDVDIDKFILCIMIIGIAFIGLFNLPEISIFLFGLVFFLAGHFIGLYVNVFGLIFLFSHSVTGIFLMEGALIGELLKSPIMSDNPQNVYIYLGINIAIFIVATLIVILHNLSMNFRERKHVILIPMSIYALAFFMSGLLPKIVDWLYLI